MRWWNAAILLLLLSVLLPAAPAVARPDAYAALDAHARSRMRNARVPGLAYAVVGPGGPVHQRAWGKDGRGRPVTAGTPFLWGSVAKPAAATAVMALVRSGRLGLDDRVVEHLPRFRFGGAAHASRVTVRHLLNQTAGIPERPTLKLADCFGCPRPAERLGGLDGVDPLGPPGSRYAYASANYLVLAAVVEAVTRRPFAEHLRRAVLDPAGMDGAIADAATASRRGLPPGHQLMWGMPSAVADGFDDHGAAYGYLGGDLNDLAAFAAFQLRSGDGTLAPEDVRLMRREGRPGSGYGMGWRVGGLKPPLDRAVWHTGATPGYSAMVFLIPERGLALVLHQNLHGLLHDGAVMQVGFDAARLLAGGGLDGAPSATGYHAAVWGVTVLALGLVLAAGRSVVRLRRPEVSRRSSVAWVLVGVVPLALAVWASGQIGVRSLATWLPDAFAALCVAVAAGVVTVVCGAFTLVRCGSRRR
ncbi:serine hydrolase domain-containing protein [Actinomadura kijaniata]|uniref:CubicO group peptidase (Beta-lactamase class C family) n=1 Tax=Actinomadura namibiensis TaxID=182080 RepID=A0A7W3QKJ1_ACTNM|nr:serine hydrolase domain-containing protein [Actinomadura namibiensis]MBA8950472.1 CubicO group peptidase (beta-lactamase class C family) [Actinomadura namibiensis]